MPTISLAPLALAIFLIALTVAKRTGGFWGRARGLVLVGSVVLFALVVAYNSLTIVPPGTVKVEVFLGKVKPMPLLPGPYWTNPQSHFTEMATSRREISLKGANAVIARTKNADAVKIEAVLAYALQPEHAPEVFTRLGQDEKYDLLMNSAARAAVADAIAALTAIDAEGPGRAALAASIDAHFKAILLKQLTAAGFDAADASEAFLVLPVMVESVKSQAEAANTAQAAS